MKVRVIWGIGPVVVAAAVLMGGAPSGSKLPSEGRLYWDGAVGELDDYVPVRMHRPALERDPRSVRGQGDARGFVPESWLDGQRDNSGALVGPPRMDHRSVRDRDEMGSIFDQTGRADAERERSGWGWLADEVLINRRDVETPSRRDGQDSDRAWTDPTLEAPAGQANDPYAELYDMWDK